MADLDKETAEEAYKAFEEQAGNIDAWEAAVDENTEEDKEETKEETKEEPEVSAETEPEPERKVEPDVPGDTSKVGLINSKLTREQAKRLTVPDYDEFDDVVDDKGVRPERLAEYTSVIPFWYKSFKDGTEKMGMLPKYPRFLDRFGVSEASRISMGDVLKEFSPKLYEQLMDADMDADRLAKSGGEIIAKRGLDFSRKLDEEDYKILERNGVKDFRKYKTVAEVTGLSEGIMDVDPDEGCVYNADYAEAMAGLTGNSEDADVEVVSLDDVIGGLNPKFLKGFLGKNASEIREADADIPEEEESEPFMPFSSGKPAEPGSIFKAMQQAESEQKPDKPW
jgi:hypothetical protein